MQLMLYAFLLVAVSDIQGSVSLDSEIPIDSPILVQLVRGTTVPIDSVYSSVGGRFVFHDVAPGLYNIRIQHEGFEDAFQRVEVPLTSPVPPISLHRRYEDPEGEPVLGDRYHVSLRQLAIPEDAIRHYEKALNDLNEGKTERGIHHLQRAIDTAPDFIEAVYRLADVFSQQQRYDEAEQLVRRTIAANPTESRMHLFLAKVFLKEHKYKEALAEVDLYLKNGIDASDRAAVEKFRAKLNRHAQKYGNRDSLPPVSPNQR